MAHTHTKRESSGLLLLIAGLLPLVLGLLFTFFEAQQNVKRQQVAAADALLTQTETVTQNAWDMINQLKQYTDDKCVNPMRKIQQLGSLSAYFRAVGTFSGPNVTCSSAFGRNPGTLSQMVLGKMPAHPYDWMYSIGGTYGVPHRPAVLFMHQLPSSKGVYVVVEGQYLMDFMRAIGAQRGYQLTLRVNGGYTIQTGHVEPDDNLLFSGSTYRAESQRFPISVSVTSSKAEALKNWRQAFFIFLPLAIILSLLCMLLAVNWLKHRLSWRDELRKGIRNGEFLVHYQPVWQVEERRCAGVEALLRWQRHDGRQVRPDMFIAAAEAEGMIIPLTRHLLNIIADEAQTWSVAPGFHLGVNVAAEHIQHPDFLADIRQFAARLREKQMIITLELTERSLIHEGPEVANKLATLRREGIRVAIDDFGTGHCSLSYLQNFQLDYLKIDRGFINAIESLEGETPVLDAIISLSHKLALEVLGEGVETPLQFEYLKNHGVNYIQGYLYARPLNSAALMAWLTKKGSLPPGTPD
ncbi:EAL domain-containing protein [Paramixta manurensis]|uniref:cyclic-guanylate-specific phosphodiesterase n=1 Tax=Paramixta manurensis TaxID=2740817 RepID=A0A6M8UC46_9GAMM|nr:EAL domain-containing protein [Erwiniaceae bacterium PD-1]